MTSETQESKSFFRRHWEEYKEFWGERFSVVDTYKRLLYPDKPVPHWDSSDVERFIASDPVHGPALKRARESAKFGVVGAAVGAVSTAGWSYRWSRSLHGSAMSFAFGAVVGGTFGLEIANHWYQLYRLDTMAAQVKFFEWLQDRA
ncbi:succinate dehydrogenase subunit 6, mitochondrial [Andrographis paniculata]|uniref:succinate dehydrogenase subunit 6, mitochondrial n=1 Tax=Andrographis paniculata TaxID=175694 RepID=UPI0021E8399F|nr:succinate dehydrogenase subunit 6, mitochondrial [Andrographis paniculata]